MPDQRSGVLLVTRNFPPLRGGMERLNQRMLQGLAMNGPVALVGPTGCGAFAPKNIDVREVSASPLWRFFAGALPAALRQARKQRPRIVLAGSGLTAPLAWLAARVTGAHCAVYLHGLDLIVPNVMYQRLWLPLIRHCDIAIANSSNTMRLAVERGVDAGRIQVIHPGTDLPDIDPGGRLRFRRSHGLGERPLLLSVGRFTQRKGLTEFVRDAFPAVLARHPNALLLVIGADATDALTASPRAGSQRQRIVQAAREAGIEHALRLMPPCDDATLSDAFRAADVHVFPVRDVPGDVEGFGMVAIEAAAHGLPTVSFRVGGVPDAIVEGVSGDLADPGDYPGFAERVSHWIADKHQSRAQCVAAAQEFAWDRFDQQISAAVGAQARAPA